MVLGDSLVPDFVSALQLAPKCHWGSKTLAEDLSVKGGSLLELLAVSCESVEELIKPVAMLMAANATASAPHILAAARRSHLDPAISNRWTELWRLAAQRNLGTSLSALQAFLKRRCRPSRFYHRIHADESQYPQPFRSVDCRGSLPDVPVVSCFDSAVVVAVAVAVDDSTLADAIQLLLNHRGHMRSIFWQAIVDECELAAEISQAPNCGWLRAWIAAGSRASDSYAWLQDEGDLELGWPLQHLAQCCAESSTLLEAVELLVTAGDCVGLSDDPFTHDVAADLILLAVQNTPAEDPGKTAWTLAWQNAAYNRLAWICDKWFDYDEDVPSQISSVATRIGVYGRAVEHAGMLGNDSRDRSHHRFHLPSWQTGATGDARFLLGNLFQVTAMKKPYYLL